MTTSGPGEYPLKWLQNPLLAAGFPAYVRMCIAGINRAAHAGVSTVRGHDEIEEALVAASYAWTEAQTALDFVRAEIADGLLSFIHELLMYSEALGGGGSWRGHVDGGGPMCW